MFLHISIRDVIFLQHSSMPSIESINDIKKKQGYKTCRGVSVRHGELHNETFTIAVTIPVKNRSEKSYYEHIDVSERIHEALA